MAFRYFIKSDSYVAGFKPWGKLSWPFIVYWHLTNVLLCHIFCANEKLRVYQWCVHWLCHHLFKTLFLYLALDNNANMTHPHISTCGCTGKTWNTVQNKIYSLEAEENPHRRAGELHTKRPSQIFGSSNSNVLSVRQLCWLPHSHTCRLQQRCSVWSRDYLHLYSCIK